MLLFLFTLNSQSSEVSFGGLKHQEGVVTATSARNKG